ncbi:atp-dependent clp protease atp-binding protein [Leptolyngbya sp. Heron Island J]|uniref:ATP-dependent Clp protease ATP-binding subunit n=1 Tax=Leptolyngbya sp. Heron Island J TaxID=1385935 RepID=UPI0003B969F4|nr:ATP-dependent Clp protease ATP-binding subunit [Leptolyngbya sp. Heron Island J]ESA37765.1 atp-dependent clp protease atp-binding protein [Leptolyngbya sp. Heron Island J]
MLEHFNDKAMAAIMTAQQEASQLNQQYVGPELILVGATVQGGSVISRALKETGVTLRKLHDIVDNLLMPGTQRVTIEIPFTLAAKQILEQSVQEAQQLNQPYVGPEHLLLAIVNSADNAAAKILQHLGVNLVQLRKAIIQAINEESAVPVGNGQESAANNLEGKALGEFTADLTKLAAQRKIDPVVGRDKEIERVVQILGRRSKNNPVLIGEPGVGKTAIAEGLAQRIINQDVPEILIDQRVLSLDIGSLVAGTSFRGEFEERLKRIVDEVNTAGNIILLIDEVHTLVGAGGTGGSMDAANMLKPALARGELQCIGATTLDEYRQYIEKDAALERRFQPVMVNEPSVEETIEILQGVRANYEQHHRLLISDQALEAAVKLSDRYIADRYLPDKAIDLIDEAGSLVHLRYSQTSPVRELKQSLRQITWDKEAAVNAQDFEKAGQLRDQEVEMEAKLQQFNNNRDTTKQPVVEADDIAQVVASWTGIPVTQVTQPESARLMKLEDTLHQRLIGQDDAVNAVAKAIRRARVGLRSVHRPIASFIFCGPTGVGKTELTKALADSMFSSEDAIIRLDMSEYMESQSVSKLIGSPPGYVGYGDGGQLTEAVRRKPYSVVLFDEIEKAHPDVFNVMLQLLEDGRLTDSQGRVVDFKNTLIIMTSNIGSRAIEKKGNGLGFEMVDGDDELAKYNRTRTQVDEALKLSFRPEFLNRLDEIIVFHQLNRNEVKQIASILLQEVSNRLADQQIQIEVTEAFKDKLVTEGFDPSYGARPLRRAITRLVEDYLAEAILAGQLQAGDTATLDIDDDGQVTVRQKQALALVSAC